MINKVHSNVDKLKARQISDNDAITDPNLGH